MKSNQTRKSLRVRSLMVATACAVALSGCNGLPFELPFELPQLPELPFELPDLSNIPNPLESLFPSVTIKDACAARLDEVNSTVTDADLVKAGYLTVGIRSDASAPSVIKSTSGVANGIDIDLGAAIADSLGLPVRFVTVSAADAALAEGSCDIVMGVSSEHVSSSTVYGGYSESASAFFRKGTEGMTTAEELYGKTVGVQDGSVSQGLLNNTELAMAQTTYSNLNDAFDALEAGTVDYVLCDAYSGAYLAAIYDDVFFAGAMNAPTSLGVAVSSANPALQGAVDTALGAIQGNGVMGVVRATWVGEMPTVGVDQVIQNIPLKQAVPAEGEVEPQDGSTAGANAATPY